MSALGGRGRRKVLEVGTEEPLQIGIPEVGAINPHDHGRQYLPATFPACDNAA